MSAKWRRRRKHSKRFDILTALDKAKNKNPSGKFRLNARIKRYAYPYRHWGPTTHRERKHKEPEPLIDVFEEKDEIVVVAEFAGFKRENLKIHVKNQRLTLSAEASDQKYYKSLNLPKRVIPNDIHTTHKNGVLQIRLKKSFEENLISNVGG